jgi:dTDP-glucose 4,6-dehydratase
LTCRFGQSHWKEAAKVRILVTGGAGFIGSNYVRRIADGTLGGISRITVLDKLTYAGTLTNLSEVSAASYKFIEGDICDAELVGKLVSENDFVVNFAAESHVDRSINGAKDFVVTNVLGTQTLLDAVRKSDVKTYLQVSTDEVYGSIADGSWPETDPLLPNSPYAASKASADLICRSYFKTHDMDIRVTRCSNNYGRNQYPEKVIPLFVTNLIDDKKVPVYGSGLNVRDWLHVDDHCNGIHLALTKGKAGEIYNIGGGTELNNLELTDKILDIMGKGRESIEYVEDRKGHDLRYSVDITKISNELGYAPQVGWEVGLKETIKWYQENEAWWRPLKK